MVLTVCVYSNDEVISHGLGLSQLVGVAIMDHVIAGRKKDKKNIHKSHIIVVRCSSCRNGSFLKLCWISTIL